MMPQLGAGIAVHGRATRPSAMPLKYADLR